MTIHPSIGKPISRLEAKEKVTGAARYAGDYSVDGMLYGYIVNATITKGKILHIHADDVLKLPGVVTVISHENRLSLPWLDLKYADMDAPPGKVFKPLYDNEVKFNGQPIAMIVAETFEMARYAAFHLRIDYQTEEFRTNLGENLESARPPKVGLATSLKPPPPKDRGDFVTAFEHAAVKATGTFHHGTEHHNPIELFASTVVYEGDNKLTIYDKTQGTVNSQLYVANIFGLHYKDVRVISPYVGGAFGSGLRPQYQLFFAAMAALQLKRSIRVTLDRSQMFTFGHRPPTIQNTMFGSTTDGLIIALSHEAVAETSQFEDYTEVVVNWSNMLYPAQNVHTDYKLVPLDVYSPLDMRAPGGSTGMHAIESTIDELAYKTGIDPLEFRYINYANTDVSVGRPYSSKELKECFAQGAERFGWHKRSPAPRSMRRGNRLVGYGMATGIWEAMTAPARAKAMLDKDGKLVVSSAITDIGTGTLTVMTQIAADEFGLPIDEVSFHYGDSKMPLAPIQGASWTVSTIGSAIKLACKALKEKILKKARTIEGSPLGHATLDDVAFINGQITLIANPSAGVSLKDVIQNNQGRSIAATKLSVPNPLKLKKYSRAVHSAAFVEVEVDEELGVVNVTRAVTAVAAGTIINPKTARSQILGGMIWSISKALREETIPDHRYGKYVNPNLAEYHIPVHADIHDLDVIFVDEKDEIVNPLGAKGVGEIGLVGMPPAIANAIFHATGKRINSFPIHFESLM